MTGDVITSLLRLALVGSAAYGAWLVRGLYKRSNDVNWIPWAFFGIGLVLYSLAVVALVESAAVTVANWWRPVLSTLILWVIWGSLWALRRAVRHG